MSAPAPHTEEPGRSSPVKSGCEILQSPGVSWSSGRPWTTHHVVTEREAGNAGVRVSWLSGIHALSYSPSCSQAELMTVRVLTRTVTIVLPATSIKVLTHIFIRSSSSSSCSSCSSCSLSCPAPLVLRLSRQTGRVEVVVRRRS